MDLRERIEESIGIRTIKSRRMKWAGPVVCIGDMRRTEL